MKQSHPPAYEQSPAKRLRAAGAVQQPRPSLSLLFATPLGFFVTCLMLLIREAHVSPRVSVAHGLRPVCDLVVITEGRKEQIYCADSGSLVARDFDWMTPSRKTSDTGRCESASRSLSRSIAPGAKQHCLGMPSRAATQDAMAHISTRASSKARNLDRSTINRRQRSGLLRLWRKVSDAGLWSGQHPGSERFPVVPLQDLEGLLVARVHHDHLDRRLVQRRLVLEHAAVAHLVDLETVLALAAEADRLDAR